MTNDPRQEQQDPSMSDDPSTTVTDESRTTNHETVVVEPEEPGGVQTLPPTTHEIIETNDNDEEDQALIQIDTTTDDNSVPPPSPPSLPHSSSTHQNDATTTTTMDPKDPTPPPSQPQPDAKEEDEDDKLRPTHNQQQDESFGLEEEQEEEPQHQEDDDDQDELPSLLFYTRLQGTSLRPPPRQAPPPPSAAALAATNHHHDTSAAAAAAVSSLPFTVDCTCSTMGQIRWSPDMLHIPPGSTSSPEDFFRTGRLFASHTSTSSSSGAAADPNSNYHSTAGAATQLLLGGTLSPATTNGSLASGGGDGTTSNTTVVEDEHDIWAAAAKLAMEQPLPIVALGMANGTVQVVNGRALPQQTNSTVVGLTAAPLTLRDEPPSSRRSHARASAVPAVVDVAVDATGTCLAAIDQGGLCCIWEYKLEYQAPTTRRRTTRGGGTDGPPTTNTNATPSSNPNPPSASVFTSFMSALTGSSTNTTTTTSTTTLAGSDSTNSTTVGVWRLAALQVHRISYPQTFVGGPTVLVMDPAYKRKREKTVLVGFADGRLLMTKRGLLFQRRVDNVLYQQAATSSTTSTAVPNSTSALSSSSVGIQAVAWRGSLVAWADATGIRLLDADAVVRIAHIDPPVGARPSLYRHQLTGMKPHLCWETSHELLVAWGDCLLQLHLSESKGTTTSHTPLNTTTTTSTSSSATTQPPPQQPASSSSVSESHQNGGASSPDTTTTTAAAGASSSSQPVVRRRTVECTMAWQLDCVACGVVPLDAHHVMVLGAAVVAPPTDDDDDWRIPPHNDMELQILSRVNGQVTYADVLPLIRKPQPLPSKRGGVRGGHNQHTGTTTSPRMPKNNNNKSGSTTVPESIASFSLLSTFCMPRMDNAVELQQEQQQQQQGAMVPGTSFDFLYGAVDSASVMPGASLVGAAAGVPPSLLLTGIGNGNTNTSSGGGGGTTGAYADPHVRWNLNMVAFDVDSQQEQETKSLDAMDRDARNGLDGEAPDGLEEDDDDQNSVDSDHYDFVCHPVTLRRSIPSSHPPHLRGGEANNDTVATVPVPPQAPSLLVVSSSDAVAVRLRTVDDAIDHALEKGKPALALQRAIAYSSGLRDFTMGDVVNEYYRALLRLPSVDDNDDNEPTEQGDGTEDQSLSQQQQHHGHEHRGLSLRRMKLAAFSMPVLLGGDVGLWSKWIGALGEIPGSLFVVWNWIPVRDPILPKHVYTNALCRMIQHVDHLRRRDNHNSGVDLEKLVVEAENHFLQALLAWGSTLVLKEFLKLYRYQTTLSSRYTNLLAATEKNLRHRYDQTSAVYLSFPVRMEIEAYEDRPSTEISTGNEFPDDLGSLFQIERMMEFLSDHLKQSPESSKVVLEAKARLSMMKGSFEDALQSFLLLGARHGPITLEEVEATALRTVEDPTDKNDRKPDDVPHSFLIPLIENRNLHQCLLDSNFMTKQADMPPIFALLQLVGLNAVEKFLLDHCVAPREVSKSPRGRGLTASPQPSAKERSHSMPLDVVATQMDGSPKILFWYLHALFIHKPELYVSFPKTANLPASITLLYRKGLDLYIKYAGDKRDSTKALAGIESYRVTQVDTPLLAFLRVVLEIGGMTPAEVGKRLQIERKGGAGVSRIFALELAYLMENYGNDSGEELRLILDLYLKGAKSLVHAVSFAQRKKQYSTELWEVLIDYCLATSSAMDKKQGPEASVGADGSLFGQLLEAAALSGANLAHLVSQIPPGMSIEGLRPRLVAAVADYRWKLQMHEGSSQVASSEKIDLLREVTHRRRRGVRYHPSDAMERPLWAQKTILPTSSASTPSVDGTPDEPVSILPPNLRPKIRKAHNWLSYSQPYR